MVDIQSLEKFEGIEAVNKPVLAALMKSVELASSIPQNWQNFVSSEVHRMSRTAALSTVNTLLAASSAKCTLAAPPADIDMVSTGSGELIYRCQHPHPHSWKLSGDRI